MRFRRIDNASDKVDLISQLHIVECLDNTLELLGMVEQVLLNDLTQERLPIAAGLIAGDERQNKVMHNRADVLVFELNRRFALSIKIVVMLPSNRFSVTLGTHCSRD